MPDSNAALQQMRDRIYGGARLLLDDLSQEELAAEQARIGVSPEVDVSTSPDVEPPPASLWHSPPPEIQEQVRRPTSKRSSIFDDDDPLFQADGDGTDPEDDDPDNW